MKNFMKSITAPRALAFLVLGAVAAAAHAAGFIHLGAEHAGAALLAFALTGEMDVKGLEEGLKKISDQVKEAAEKAMAEAAKGVQMSSEQKARVDEILLKQGEFQQQIKELEQKAARQAGQENSTLKSMGFQVIESKDFKSRVDTLKDQRKGSMSLDVKAVTTASVPNAVVPQRLDTIQMLPNRRLTIRDLVAPGRTSSSAITYMKETGFTNNAAPVAEGNRKPESTIAMVQVTETVKKLAHFIKASKEILDDFPQLQSVIDGRLTYGLKLVEENQLLKGSGTGNNLNGIYTQATAFLLPTGAAPTPAATIAGNIDKLRFALLQAELAEFPSDGIVLNPIDWANIELAKDTQGRYLIGNPQGTLAPTLWNRPVVSTQAMTVNTFLAGAFQMGAQIFDREDAGIVIATENEDDFVNNLVTILIEERLAMAVYRPEAFIKGTLAAA
jgi:HK97 family phage major capsid protein